MANEIPDCFLTLKIDISTGDEITPAAIEFSYPAML